MTPIPSIDTVRDYLTGLQDRICTAIELADGGARFVEDAWTRAEGGGGRTRILREGAVFEQAGIGFSDVRAMRDGETVAWWFGGGFDLTPFYPFDEDVLHWHRVARSLCEPFGGQARYEAHKRWCDEYFFLRHRNETRGVGGLFFDDLHGDFETDFGYLRAVGDGFLAAYLPIVQRRKDTPWGERERQFQLYRRGRYVEFNHPVRPAIGRAHRIDPDEPAPAGALGIRLRAGRRQRRGAAGRLPAGARLAGSAMKKPRSQGEGCGAGVGTQVGENLGVPGSHQGRGSDRRQTLHLSRVI